MTERSTSETSINDQFSATPSTETSSTYSTSSSTTDQAMQTAQGAADQAKQAVQGAADQAKQVASDVAGQAREQATGQLARQKERAASSLGSVADALRTTGQQLDQNEQAAVGKYVNQAADQVERFQGYLQNQDIGAIVDDVERMAREQPVVFLGSAFVLGLLGARFLKSSGRGGRSGSSYGRSSGYTAGGYSSGRYSSGNSTYGPSGTTSGTSYGGSTGSSYGTTSSTASDSDFLTSSLTGGDVAGTGTLSTGSATDYTTGSSSDYSPGYGTGLTGTGTSDRTREGGTGGL